MSVSTRRAEYSTSKDWQRTLFHGSVHYTYMTDEEIGARETNNQEELRKWPRTLQNEEMYDDMHCNNCFVQAHGRQELGKLYIPFLEQRIGRQKVQLVQGIDEKMDNLSRNSFECPNKWTHEVYNITDGYSEIWRASETSDEFYSMGVLSCYKALINFLSRTKNAGKNNNCRNWHGMEGQVDGMRKDYDHRLVQLEWIKDIILQVKEPGNVEKTVEWALGDTTRLLYF